MAKQLIIAVSADFKSFVQDMTATFSGASKSKEDMAMTEKEACDAILALVKSRRFEEVEETNEETNEVIPREVDHLAVEAERTIAERGGKSRANSTDSKIADLKDRFASILRKKFLAAGMEEGEELEAMIAEEVASL